jgi:hypothetical protein
MAPDPDIERLALADAADLLLNECRMVLPGIQALFGFQLIAVFSERFARLEVGLQHLHLVATGLVVVGIALIMTPASYHRLAGGRHVTGAFIRISARLLLASMFPLATAVCLEFYLVMRVVTPRGPAGLLATATFALYVLLWFVLPRLLGATARRKAVAPHSGGKR